MKDIPKGIALTEFYDLLVLKSGSGISDNDLKKELYSLMSKWKPEAHHKEITEWAMHNNSPILTTNFDNTLGNAANCELLKMTHVRKQFTDYYPWICYYGHTDLHDPCIGFGIWHINGMEYYRRSIRLGLTHYMGSVQRARSWIYERNKDRLFFDRDSNTWRGNNTWLHVVFNKPLLFFGLGLEQNEIFLRWLLIERARYFRKYPDREKPAWYVHSHDDPGSGKLFFLDSIGIKPVKADNFDEIYGSSTWQN